MPRVLSLPGLSAAVWVSCLAFEGLLAGIVAVVGWHAPFPARDGDAGPRIHYGPGSHRRCFVTDRPRAGPASCPVVPLDRRSTTLVPGRPFPSRRGGQFGAQPAPRSSAEAARCVA